MRAAALVCEWDVCLLVAVVYWGDAFDGQHVIGYLASMFIRIVCLGSMRRLQGGGHLATAPFFERRHY